MSFQDYSSSREDVEDTGENTYCVVLNIVEGIGLIWKKDNFYIGVNLKVSLNGVIFDVEGNFMDPNLIIFNSNCIWECELEDIKRIKLDNRPIKVECSLKHDYHSDESNSHIGSLLLPLRGVKIVHNLANVQLKPHWFKLSNLGSEYRQNTPQICIMLAIVKKAIVEHIHLETILNKHSIKMNNPSEKALQSSNVNHTLSMLQSQHGIFVKLLEDIGQIQVGNDPLVDRNIFRVTLNFKQIKYVSDFLKLGQKTNEIKKPSFIFQYDFLGSISNIEIVINANDSYTINQQISLTFRSSLRSLRLYFQRIFYIPIKLYCVDDIAIAKYDFKISSFLPEEIKYWRGKGRDIWIKYGSFQFDILKNILSTINYQPSVEFMLALELLTTNSNEKSQETAEEAKSNLAVVKNLHSQRSKYEKESLKLTNLEICDESEKSLVTKSVCSIAVNTDDNYKVQEIENMYLYFLHLFQEWKKEEIKRILNDLALTKQSYMQELKSQWEQYKNYLLARLEIKIRKCDQLFGQLENIQKQVNAIVAISVKNATIADNITSEIESSYRTQILQLETKLKSLKKKIEQKETENFALMKSNDRLKKEVAILQSSHLSLDQLKDILIDMRKQTSRFVAIESFYEEQCFNNVDVFKLKFEISKFINEQKILKNFEAKFCMEELLKEEIINANPDHIESIQVSFTDSLK